MGVTVEFHVFGSDTLLDLVRQLLRHAHLASVARSNTTPPASKTAWRSAALLLASGSLHVQGILSQASAAEASFIHSFPTAQLYNVRLERPGVLRCKG